MATIAIFVVLENRTTLRVLAIRHLQPIVRPYPARSTTLASGPFLFTDAIPFAIADADE